MATKKKAKKVEKEVVPAKPVLEDWQLVYATRLKWDVKTRFMALEFIMQVLRLKDDNEGLTYARDILANLKRSE